MKAWALAILVSVPTAAMARPNNPPLALSEYQKQDWHVEDGLPQGNVRTIIQSPERLLLIGTSEGVAAFDGAHFTSFQFGAANQPANEPVNALLIDHHGNFWIGTDDRGVILRQGTSTFAISEDAGFHQDRIRALYEDHAGDIWVATQNGVERIHDRHVELFETLGLVSGDVTSPFAEDSSGNLFIVTSKGLFRRESSQIIPFKIQQRELGDVTAVYGDHHGTVWIGGYGGLLKLQPSAKGDYSEEFFKDALGLVTSLIQDHDGYLWIGTKGHGISRLAPSGSFSRWTTSDGLPDDTIRSLYEDDEGDLWIGMLSGGISRWRKATLLPLGPPEGLPSGMASTVLADKRGDLWLGTWGSGLLRMQQGHLERVHLQGAPSNAHIRALAEDHHGNVWIGTWFNGIYQYDGTNYRHFVTGRESIANAVSALLVDKKNQLWVGTYKGLLRFSSGFPETNKGDVLLPGMLITSLKEDMDGSLVVGTFKGLFRLRDSNVEPITEKDGLSNNFILSVSVDSFGGVWVGTKAGGVDWVRGHQVIHASPKLGIPAYSVFSVLDDRHGQFWMSTNRGLLRVPLSDMYDLVSNSRKTENAVLLGKSDGMRSGECSGASQPPSGRTLDGALWFATAKGFVHTSPSEQPFSVPATMPFISSLTVNESPLATSDELNLPAGPNDFSIQFGAVRLANPWQVQFRYKLEGYDRDWTTTWTRHIRYQHLAPGHYRFLVSARDAGQLWNDDVASLSVIQKPFFYQTSWFYLVVGLALVGVVGLLFRWRLARLHQGLRLVMEERNRIAREWHDTLMAGLAAISWQLEATRARLIKNPGEATSFLDLARKMVGHSQAEARRIIWDLQDDSESSGPLSEAVSSALKRLGSTADITPELRVNGVEASLSPLAVHHLVRICQEAVTNAVRHAAPTSIQVDLDYQPSAMTLSVKDNGSGFPSHKATVPGHFGLTVMEERARKLGGTLRVQSSPGAGTEIFVKVPVESGAASV